MQIVVVYDIPENKRRERLRKALRRFGNAVQKSVFECDLSARQIESMERVIRGIMDASADNVRYYKLCQACTREVEVFGGRRPATVLKAYVV
jgi:CRISPR-associated protein Cas2